MSVDWNWEPPARRRRRWPWALAFVATVGVAFLGVAGGAARSTADAAAEAAAQRAHGDFGRAAALYLQIAKRGSPLYVLARNSVAGAALEEQKTLLAWARSLAAQGRIDQALHLAGGVTDPSLRASAAEERAALLLGAAKSAAAGGDYGAALLRLQELQRLEPVSPVAAQGVALLAQYEVGEAHSLVVAGRGADAVDVLDDAMRRGPADRAAAMAVMPDALLAAGQEDVAALSFKEAAAMFQRLVKEYPATPQAATARSVLNRRQPVAGTLTDKKGSPISGQIRLSSDFQNLGGSYLTSGPFFYSTADANGNFLIDSVPVGGPYVLEVFRNGGWTTLIDPTSGRPAEPVNVTPLEPVDLTFVVLPA